MTILFTICLIPQYGEAKMNETESTVSYKSTFNQLENIQVPNTYKKLPSSNINENEKLPITGEVEDIYNIYGFIFIAICFLYLVLFKYRRRGKERV